MWNIYAECLIVSLKQLSVSHIKPDGLQFSAWLRSC
jgi:hypothetical protein